MGTLFSTKPKARKTFTTQSLKAFRDQLYDYVKKDINDDNELNRAQKIVVDLMIIYFYNPERVDAMDFAAKLSESFPGQKATQLKHLVYLELALAEDVIGKEIPEPPGIFY